MYIIGTNINIVACPLAVLNCQPLANNNAIDR